MRPENVERLGMRGQHRANDLELPEHRRGEDVESCSVGEEQLGDVAPADVRGSSQRGLPVAATPIPTGVRERGVDVESFAHRVEVAMGVGDELAHEAVVESGWGLHGRYN